MSLYWRKYKTNQNTDLPQKIMRPFWHVEAEKLNDKVFSTVLLHEKPKILQYVILFLTLPLFHFSVNGFLLFKKTLSDIRIWNNNDIYLFISFSAVLVIAFLLIFLFFKMTRQRILSFNREKHTICSAKGALLPHYLNHNYDELTGAIECYKNIFGKRKTWLVLKHQAEKYKIRLCYTYDSPQDLIGYWSFIVQYMKKDAPLPDVPALCQYPDRIKGVISG